MNIETIQPYVTLIKDILTGFAALTAAVIAVMGFQTWKKQLQWKTKYELAQRLAKTTYGVRDALNQIRDPCIGVGELLQNRRNQQAGKILVSLETFLPSQKAEYNKRWQKVQDAFTNLDAISLEAEAILGAVIRENTKLLVHCSNKISKSVEIYWDSKENPEKAYPRDATNPGRYIIFGVPNSFNNHLSDEINEGVIRIENFLKPHLKI